MVDGCRVGWWVRKWLVGDVWYVRLHGLFGIVFHNLNMQLDPHTSPHVYF